MHNLWWKQWREYRGIFALLTAWMVLGAGYAIAYEMTHPFRAIVGRFHTVAFFYTCCGAILLAMQAAQGERTAGTLSFSESLPVSMRKRAALRFGGAVAALVIPILVAAVLLSIALAFGIVEQAMPNGSEPFLERASAPRTIALEQLWIVAAVAAFGGAELLLIIGAVGCRLRNQAQVGFLGAVAAFGTYLLASVLWFGDRHPVLQLAYGVVLPQSLVIGWGYENYVGGYSRHEIAGHPWIALALSIPVLALIFLAFVKQYARPVHVAAVRKPARRTRARMLPWSFVSFRRPGRLWALLWLEARQSAPLAFFGLALVLLFAIAEILIEGADDTSFATSVRLEMPHMVAVIAMLWAAVVGSGLFSAELRPSLGAFLRSRPIPMQMWFWCKFIVGLVAVLAVFDGVAILMTWQYHRAIEYVDYPKMGWAYVACYPILHAFFYSAAVFATCWLRKPVLGGFVAVFGYAVVTVAVGAFPSTMKWDPFTVYNALNSPAIFGRQQIDFSQHHYPFVYGMLTASIIVLAFAASRIAIPLESKSMRSRLRSATTMNRAGPAIGRGGG